MTELDRMIFQMETTLGKPHTVSPFQTLLAAHGVGAEEVKATLETADAPK